MLDMVLLYVSAMGDWITMESITSYFCLDELQCSLVVCEIAKGSCLFGSLLV